MQNIPDQFKNDPNAPFNQEETADVEEEQESNEPDDFTGADGSDER